MNDTTVSPVVVDIVDSAERHLRPDEQRFVDRYVVVRVDIVDSAERHLRRHRLAVDRAGEILRGRYRRFSRKAFETVADEARGDRVVRVDIVDSAERHLRPAFWLSHWAPPCIWSISSIQPKGI